MRRVACEIRTSGAEAVVICYLFSFMNPVHELRTAEIVRETPPDVDLSVSSEILPGSREYERLSMAYLKRLRDAHHAIVSGQAARHPNRGRLRERLLFDAVERGHHVVRGGGREIRRHYRLRARPPGSPRQPGWERPFVTPTSTPFFDMGGNEAKVCACLRWPARGDQPLLGWGPVFIGRRSWTWWRSAARRASIVSAETARAVHVGHAARAPCPGRSATGRAASNRLSPTLTWRLGTSTPGTFWVVR